MTLRFRWFWQDTHSQKRILPSLEHDSQAKQSICMHSEGPEMNKRWYIQSQAFKIHFHNRLFPVNRVASLGIHKLTEEVVLWVNAAGHDCVHYTVRSHKIRKDMTGLRPSKAAKNWQCIQIEQESYIPKKLYYFENYILISCYKGSHSGIIKMVYLF